VLPAVTVFGLLLLACLHDRHRRGWRAARRAAGNCVLHPPVKSGC